MSPLVLHTSRTSSASNPVWLPSLLIDKLSEDVLLEVFDSYRKKFKHAPEYERHWNRIHGWLMLAHVCQKWRRIVLASPSRLDLCICVIGKNPGNMKTMLSPRLPRLPIFVDYRWLGTSTPKDISRLSTALRHRDRLRGIVFPFQGFDERTKRLLKEMKRSFPALETLEFHSYSYSYRESDSKFQLGSAPRLRCLKVDSVPFRYLTQLLPSSTMLVELSLKIEISSRVSLLPYLQAMPHLRSLVLQLMPPYREDVDPDTNTDNIDIVTLSKLTCFSFRGRAAVLDTLVAGMAAPSLHDLHVRFTDRAIASPFRHLSRFTTEIEIRHHACQLLFLEGFFRLSLLTNSEFIATSEPHFKFYSTNITQVNKVLAPKLDAVEDLLLFYGDEEQPSIPWQSFLRLFRNLRILRVGHRIIFNVAKFLGSVHCEEVLDLLPALEEIQVCSTSYQSISSTSERYRAEMGAFQPFVAAYQRAGRPVNVTSVCRFRGASWLSARGWILHLTRQQQALPAPLTDWEVGWSEPDRIG